MPVFSSRGRRPGAGCSRGVSLMQAEITEQVLADGGHFERSPMYHAAFIEDTLDAVNINRAYGYTVDAAWHPIIARMMDWLEAMSHPDMEIAFFNDAAFGVAPAVAQLRDYAARLGIALQAAEPAGLRRLMPSGYVRLDLPPFLVLCDVAPVGPDHLPAHAHADTLSFEMSYKGRRIFVNSGTSEYGQGAERQRQRGTAAHNTVVLDGENSSEVWAGFRVARRARARLVDAHAEDFGFTVAGEHQGYRRLPGRNVHRRRWLLTRRELSIGDLVEGPWNTAECYFHLHPGIGVRRTSESQLQLSDSRGDLLEMSFEGADRVEVFDSTWHPRVRRLGPEPLHRRAARRIAPENLDSRERPRIETAGPLVLFPAGSERRIVPRERPRRRLTGDFAGRRVHRSHHHGAEPLQLLYPGSRAGRIEGSADDKADRAAGASQRPLGTVPRVLAFRALRKPRTRQTLPTTSCSRPHRA